MLHVHMRHLMSHHADQFRFIVRGNNCADVDEHRTTRQSKGIDIFLRNYVELEWPRVFLGITPASLFPNCR
jgi:hypothetical protein